MPKASRRFTSPGETLPLRRAAPPWRPVFYSLSRLILGCWDTHTRLRHAAEQKRCHRRVGVKGLRQPGHFIGLRGLSAHRRGFDQRAGKITSGL